MDQPQQILRILKKNENKIKKDWIEKSSVVIQPKPQTLELNKAILYFFSRISEISIQRLLRNELIQTPDFVFLNDSEFFSTSSEIKKPKIHKIISQFDKLKSKIIILEERIKNLEKKSTNVIRLKPMISQDQQNIDFYKEEKWVSNLKLEYPGQIIAYSKKNDEWEIIAHSNNEEKLLDEIEKLYEEKVIKQEDKIIFRKL